MEKNYKVYYEVSASMDMEWYDQRHASTWVNKERAIELAKSMKDDFTLVEVNELRVNPYDIEQILDRVLIYRSVN